MLLYIDIDIVSSTYPCVKKVEAMCRHLKFLPDL